MVITDCHDLGGLSKLFDSIDILGMESSKFLKWLLQSLSLFILLLIILFLIVVDSFSLNLKNTKDTCLSSHDKHIIILGVVNK